MAWGKKKGNGATAGVFRTKTPGLYVATFSGKWFKAALSIFKEAARQDYPGVVVFLRKSDRGGPKDPVFTLGLAVNKPYDRRQIHDDPDDDPEMDEEDNEQPEVDFD